jgi:hypothetical protein
MSQRFQKGDWVEKKGGLLIENGNEFDSKFSHFSNGTPQSACEAAPRLFLDGSFSISLI